MINKQIIIDGVDVSGCECYNPNIKMDCLLHPLQSDACKNNPNCHYKLYKRKKQELTHFKKENERLLQTIIKDQAEIVQKNIDETNILLIKENMDLQQQLKRKEQECFELQKTANAYNYLVKLANYRLDKIEDLQQQLKRKEQECEELKEQLQKYRSAFEEIREDMEQDTTCESRECGCDDYAECLNCIKETILNKISEVQDA